MPPPLPPTGPTTTRLIKVVTRQASFRSSFSQLDGQDNCHLRLTAVAPPPKPQAPPTNAAEVKAAAGVKEAPAVNTPDRHPRPLARTHEKRRERLAQEESQRYCDLLQSTWEEIHASRCKICYNEFTKSDQSNYRRREWVVQLISCCMTCIELDEWEP